MEAVLRVKKKEHSSDERPNLVCRKGNNLLPTATKKSETLPCRAFTTRTLI